MILSRNLKIEGSAQGSRKVRMSHMYKGGEGVSSIV
jgi:hypothetical protein